MAGFRPKNKRKVAIATAVGVLLLSVGFLAGFFTAKHVGTSLLIKHGPPQPGDTGSVYGDDTPTPGGPRGSAKLLRQLPEPWTQQGQQLANSPGGADDMSRQLYTWYGDTTVITEQMTVAFLQQLQGQLEANGISTANVTAQRLGSANMTEIIDMFVGVARDVLSFLRARNSQALLPLLRQFSSQGTITLSDVHPDTLRAEVNKLLNLTSLGGWYADVGRYDHAGTQTLPPEAWSANRAAAAAPAAGSEQLLQGAARKADKDNDRRRLLSGSHRRMLQQEQQQQQERPLRRLHVAGVGAPIPAIPRDEAVAEGLPPTVSPVMSMNDMLCSVRSYSPTGVQGMVLPAMGSNATKGANATKGGTPIQCKSPRPPSVFRYGKTVFKRVKIPVVFHCQRFTQGDVLQPPLWRAEEAARNLIAVANKMYAGTLIQFTMQEVRVDPQKYPYLLLGSLKDWQECTGNPSQEGAGFPCLQETARDPQVVALTKRHVINVIVGGSQSPMFCNRTEEETCSSMYLGYTGSIGPWFTRPSTTWNEDTTDENWLWMTWDQFSPMVKNSWRFWDGGGVTLAHELGHYLGLMHTHEGATACEGDGLSKADSVPDTPVNRQTVQWASENGLAVQLARWCGEFRTGKKPNPKTLLAFNSCEQDPLAIDNVFNVLSYLPDMCCMLLTPNQVARLQWAIASFRPKMMNAYAA